MMKVVLRPVDHALAANAQYSWSLLLSRRRRCWTPTTSRRLQRKRLPPWQARLSTEDPRRQRMIHSCRLQRLASPSPCNKASASMRRELNVALFRPSWTDRGAVARATETIVRWRLQCLGLDIAAFLGRLCRSPRLRCRWPRPSGSRRGQQRCQCRRRQLKRQLRRQLRLQLRLHLRLQLRRQLRRPESSRGLKLHRARGCLRLPPSASLQPTSAASLRRRLLRPQLRLAAVGSLRSNLRRRPRLRRPRPQTKVPRKKRSMRRKKWKRLRRRRGTRRMGR